MGAFLVRRLLALIAVAWGVSIMAFFIARVIPGDPAQIAAGLEAGPEQVQELRRVMGLDRPVHVQYVTFLRGLLHGDFGVSLRTRRPVVTDLRRHLPATIELTFVAMVLALATGIPLGVLAGTARGRSVDTFIRLIAVSGIALPVFWLALLAQLVLYRQLGWFPAGGRIDAALGAPPTITGLYLIDSLLARDLVMFGSSLWHIFLPAAVLAFGRWATIVRMTRVSLLEVLNHDYVRTARAKGLSGSRVVVRHALRNAMIPVTTMVGVQVGFLLSGAVLVEWVFSWPGVGDYAVRSIVALDFNPIVAVATLLSVVFVLANSLVDIVYHLLDPRISV